VNDIQSTITNDHHQYSSSNETITISMPRVQLAHELLTPLNAILGFTQVLNSEKKSLQPSQREAVQAIHQAGELLLNRISSLFQFGTNQLEQKFDCINDPSETNITLAQNIHILIVDDATINRLVIKNMLSIFNNVTIDEAFDGKNALEKMKQKQPHLIFMDLYMPEMDGYRTTQVIRERYADYRMIIIGMSADSSLFNAKKMKTYGFDEFLAKPIKMRQLKKIISTYSSYFQKESASTSENLQSLSHQTNLPDHNALEKLIRFSRQGAYSEINYYLEQLEKKYPEYHTFISRIRQLVKSFNFNKIISLIKSTNLSDESLQQDEAMLHDEQDKPTKEHK